MFCSLCGGVIGVLSFPYCLGVIWVLFVYYLLFLVGYYLVSLVIWLFVTLLLGLLGFSGSFVVFRCLGVAWGPLIVFVSFVVD